MNKTSLFLNVQAYKYDGTLYRQWNGAKKILENDSYTVLLLYKTKVKEITKQKWIISSPTLWFFSKKFFFNYTLNLKEDGYHYYVNMASPFILEDDTIKYIDFDLDIKKYPNKFFSIVDHNEFYENAKKWYSKEIEDIIYENVAILGEIIVKENHFFDKNEVEKIIKFLKDNKDIDKNEFSFKTKKE
ncbi:MAG: DUF402 domain-containing protein [Metamycoplasmataceae bacterium]